jgi:hypothetical protein
MKTFDGLFGSPKFTMKAANTMPTPAPTSAMITTTNPTISTNNNTAPIPATSEANSSANNFARTTTSTTTATAAAATTASSTATTPYFGFRSRTKSASANDDTASVMTTSTADTESILDTISLSSQHSFSKLPLPPSTNDHDKPPSTPLPPPSTTTTATATATAAATTATKSLLSLFGSSNRQATVKKSNVQISTNSEHDSASLLSIVTEGITPKSALTGTSSQQSEFDKFVETVGSDDTDERSSFPSTSPLKFSTLTSTLAAAAAAASPLTSSVTNSPMKLIDHMFSKDDDDPDDGNENEDDEEEVMLAGSSNASNKERSSWLMEAARSNSSGAASVTNTNATQAEKPAATSTWSRFTWFGSSSNSNAAAPNTAEPTASGIALEGDSTNAQGASSGVNEVEQNGIKAPQLVPLQPPASTVTTTEAITPIEINSIAAAPMSSTTTESIPATPAPPSNTQSSTAAAPPATTASSQLIEHLDKKTGTAKITPSILYRYPPNTEPPPPEVCDFCLPYGAKLQQIAYKDEENIVQDIIFGHSHGKRSARCFIFLLEDKTVAPLNPNEIDEESGVGTGKLYGICVLHPRLLRTNEIDMNKRRFRERMQPGNGGGNASSGGNNFNMDDIELHTDDDYYEFESLVCYTFLTRFPFFHFFFQMLFDIISLERLRIMELTSFSDGALIHRKTQYQYVCTELLQDVLQRIVSVAPPKFQNFLKFQVKGDFPRITFMRKDPNMAMISNSITSLDYTEHDVQVLEWCFPPVIASLILHNSLHCFLWTLSFLFLESKVLIVGDEPAMVTSVVLSLLLCLHPFEWVSPVIPILPSKWNEFIESPVPILAGIVIDEQMKKEEEFTLPVILQKCRLVSTCYCSIS